LRANARRANLRVHGRTSPSLTCGWIILRKSLSLSGIAGAVDWPDLRSWHRIGTLCASPFALIYGSVFCYAAKIQ
jgi:hypothetical protein